MSLNELDIQDEYRSDRCNLIDEFYLPCLEKATLYSRAVGFFSSTSMIAVAKGLTALIRLGGKMRLVASPYLSSEDIEAITTGLKQREEVITQVLLQALDQEFEQIVRDRLACLAWLLGQGILEIKLAIPKNIHSQGIYHEKLGLFQDIEGNIVAFTGSANESSSALIDNFECLDVFCSWKLREQERVRRKAENFQRLWDNQTAKVDVIGFPEAAARSLLRLRLYYPPTQEPSIQNRSYLRIALKPRQVNALAAYQKANFRGILAMATGAGKTIAALACATCLDHLDLIMIGAPTKEIVQQWVDELDKRTTFRPPLIATGKGEVWREALFRKLRLIHRQQLSGERLPIVVVGTYSELSKIRIAELIDDAGGLPKQSLLIADEVHATGAGVYRRILREGFPYRLGLSATPIRPYDEIGTEFVLDYFGGIISEFTLEEAIATGILCEYDYHVYVTSLTKDEHAKFQELTVKISRLLNSNHQGNQTQVKRLTIQRARIIKSATAKLTTLNWILKDHPPQKMLIYCADIAQATQISHQLAQQGFNVARYSSIDKNRQSLLSYFARGYLDALVAVKCLDEGVDIPSANQGIILASDASERQFIQRRGRILRAAPRKEIATLIDILVVPPLTDEQVKLIESEIRRVIQFSRSARNQTTVITKLVEELRHYGITYSDLL